MPCVLAVLAVPGAVPPKSAGQVTRKHSQPLPGDVENLPSFPTRTQERRIPFRKSSTGVDLHGGRNEESVVWSNPCQEFLVNSGKIKVRRRSSLNTRYNSIGWKAFLMTHLARSQDVCKHADVQILDTTSARDRTFRHQCK